MDLKIEVVDADPVLEVAVETIGLFDQQNPARSGPPEECQHGVEVLPSSPLGGLDVDELADDIHVRLPGVLLQQPALSRNGIALFLLFLRRNAGVYHGLRCRLLG
ncbi:MAG TPA: hypothetical protein VND96_06440 [Candidatus Micrarchaeaceae archaeon]|nr:hypothetical protein [Candidatus Micrarchaeaceae archaeon]